MISCKLFKYGTDVALLVMFLTQDFTQHTLNYYRGHGHLLFCVSSFVIFVTVPYTKFSSVFFFLLCTVVI